MRILSFTLLVIIFPTIAFTQVDLNKGLVAYYPFSGNANDASGNGNNPVFNNATLTSDYYGKPNSAYHFNGVDNYIEIPNSASLNFNTKISLCAWVKPTGFYKGPCYNNMIISKQTADFQSGNYSLRYSDPVNGCNSNADTTKEVFYGPDGAIGSQSPIQLNQWYNVVFTSDGTTTKLYVNCKLVESQAVSVTSYTNPYDLFLGHFDNGTYPYWLNGDLDEVRIYDRALTEDEVHAYSAACNNGSCSNWAYLSGIDPGVQIGDLDVSGNTITVEALFNRTDSYDPTFYGGDIVSKHTDPTDVNYLLRPTRAEITTTTGWHGTPDVCDFKLNKTYHVAMVYDGKILKFYRNGFLMSQTPCTGNLVLNNWITRIGSTANPNDLNPSDFHGYINEVRIWNIARTQDEIRTYMNQSLPNPASQTGLLAYYTFDNLKNKQGNSQWDGNLLNNASINQTNPECDFVADSCNINQCMLKVNAGNDISICHGSSTQLKATGAATYNWNTSTALSDTTIANPIASPGSTTEFIVTGYDDSGVCSDTDTVRVAVLSLPVFTVNNDTTICKGSIVQLNANSNNSYHYHWTPYKYLSDTSISNPISNPADSVQYYITATDSNNCRTTDSVRINVVPRPTVSTIPNSRICFGDTIVLSTNITNANTFTWNPSSGLNNSSIQSPRASPKASATYTISASNGICIVKDSVLITVLSLPNVFAGNDTIICTEGVAYLNASGAITYHWYPARGLSNPNIADPAAIPGTTTTYYVVGTDNNNCVNTDSVTVFKQEDPTFTIFPQDTSICLGQSISLTASGGDTYAWSPPQSVSAPTSATTSIHPATNTKYSVIIYDSTCKIQKTLTSNIDIRTRPVITITKSNDIDCSNPEAQLNAAGGIRYTWMPDTYIDNTQIANPVVSPPSDALYIVNAIGENGCTAQDSILVKSTLGNMELYVANAFTPNGDGLNDCFGLRYWGTPATFDMMIYDKWGMQVYHSQNINECWDGTYKGKKQGSGTYVYMITANSVCGQEKVFKKGTVVLIR